MLEERYLLLYLLQVKSSFLASLTYSLSLVQSYNNTTTHTNKCNQFSIVSTLGQAVKALNTGVTSSYVTGFHITRLPHTQNHTYDFTRNGLLV